MNYFFIACNAECLTCSGPLNTNCASCDTTGETPFLYQSTCYTTCPNGTYPNTTDFKCYRKYRIFHFSEFLMMILLLVCFPTCATCDGPTQNNCINCDIGLYLSINTCVDECPSGTFLNTSSKHCEGNLVSSSKKNLFLYS